MDFYLKFESEEAAKEVLFAKVPSVVADDGQVTEWMKDDEGNDRYEQRFRNIDTIGVIYKETGEMVTDSEGIESSKVAPIDGWHVNVRLVNGEDGSVLEPYRTNPEPVTPMRVFG